MPDVSIPIFASSREGDVNNGDKNSSFSQTLQPALKVPLGARNQKMYLSSASTTYSMANVDDDCNKIPMSLLHNERLRWMEPAGAYQSGRAVQSPFLSAADWALHEHSNALPLLDTSTHAGQTKYVGHWVSMWVGHGTAVSPATDPTTGAANHYGTTTADVQLVRWVQLDLGNTQIEANAAGQGNLSDTNAGHPGLVHQWNAAVKTAFTTIQPGEHFAPATSAIGDMIDMSHAGSYGGVSLVEVGGPIAVMETGVSATGTDVFHVPPEHNRIQYFWGQGSSHKDTGYYDIPSGTYTPAQMVAWFNTTFGAGGHASYTDGSGVAHAFGGLTATYDAVNKRFEFVTIQAADGVGNAANTHVHFFRFYNFGSLDANDGTTHLPIARSAHGLFSDWDDDDATDGGNHIYVRGKMSHTVKQYLTPRIWRQSNDLQRVAANKPRTLTSTWETTATPAEIYSNLIHGDATQKSYMTKAHLNYEKAASREHHYPTWCSPHALVDSLAHNGYGHPTAGEHVHQFLEYPYTHLKNTQGSYTAAVDAQSSRELRWSDTHLGFHNTTGVLPSLWP